MKKFLLTIVVILGLVGLRMCLYAVDATEYAYVTQLGRHLATHDGGNPTEGPGLHFGLPWPIQSIQRLDRRLQFFDLPERELLTRDADGKAIDKNLVIQAYVCWQIQNVEAVDKFIKGLGTPDRARDILARQVNSQLASHIVQMQMEDLIGTSLDPKTGRLHVEETLSRLRDDLVAGLRPEFREKFGIELVDIRIRRISHPEKTRDEIFKRIRSERQKKVEEIRSAGNLQRKKIESEAEEKVRNILADARYQEEKIKGEADTKAVSIRNEAHSKDYEFYTFLKKLEKMQSILGDNKTVLLLSSHREIFDLLFQPPRPNGPAVSPPGTPKGPASYYPPSKSGGK